MTESDNIRAQVNQAPFYINPQLVTHKEGVIPSVLGILIRDPWGGKGNKGETMADPASFVEIISISGERLRGTLEVVHMHMTSRSSVEIDGAASCQ